MRRANAVDFSSANAIAIVTDRLNEADFTDACGMLGGAWAEGPKNWPPRYAYAIAIAPTMKRIRKRAPYLLYAMDSEQLRDALQFCCSKLDDVQCLWLFLLEDGPANDLARAVVLADCKVEGHA